MKLGSTLSQKFFDTYRHLPPGIRAIARESYRLFVADPASVKFKALKMLRKIISGGQTGADRAGLDFAIETGLKHGGYYMFPGAGRQRTGESTSGNLNEQGYN